MKLPDIILKNKIVFGVLTLLFTAQIFACAYQIFRYESILAFGRMIVLTTRAYDPYDAFRGRYINTSIPSQTFYTDKKLCKNTCAKDFFVTYKDGLNEQGLSEIDDVFLTEPKTELAYMKTSGYFKSGSVAINYKFDRYYMREDLARAVDRDSRLVSANNKARVVVRALNGKGLIEDILIGDENQSLNQYLIDQADEKDKVWAE